MNDLFNTPGRKTPQGSYSAQDIEVLEGLEPVRKRPGMYIGGTDENALHHLAAEVFDNAMDEAVAGFASRINIELLEDNYVKISDNGRGIPTDPHPKFPDKSALEVILTTLHSGGKFNSKVYYTSGGLHGVGISVVNALSDKMQIKVIRDQQLWQQEFARGIPTTALIDMGQVKNKKGTQIIFHPDPEIFGNNVKFKPSRLYKLAKSKAYLFRGVEIKWRCYEGALNKTSDVPIEETIHFPEGLKDYLKASLTPEEIIAEECFYGEVAFEDGIGRLEWAINWTGLKDGLLSSYCNTVSTPLGGTHENGFKNALLKSFRDFGERTGNKKAADIIGDDILKGIYGVLSLFIREPQFQGQTKEKLANKEVAKLVENFVKDHFDLWLSANKNDALKLLDFIVENAEERMRRKKQKDIARKSFTQRLRLPGKLSDCTEQDRQNSEIFIVEGDSAGGSAKMARDRKTQAVLPLRGKILNVASATADKIKANQEISDLNLALGCGELEHYNEDNLRYDKVIIMTDADVDGAHIASLLMTYFLKFVPNLIHNGHLYLAMPPLYRIRKNNESFYASTEEEKEQIILNISNKKGNIEVTRFKGLGEMTPSQLKETTMDKTSRRLLNVSINEDGYVKAQSMVENLMGKKPELRFKFITEQSALLGDDIKDKLDV